MNNDEGNEQILNEISKETSGETKNERTMMMPLMSRHGGANRILS